MRQIDRFCLIVFGFLSLCGCQKNAARDEILLGEVQTLTGSEAGIGIAIHQGIELAVQSINAAGGVSGKQLRLITLDDQGRPEEAATATTQLITQSKVVALLGASASSRSIAMASIAQRFHIPMLTPTSTHPKVTEMGEFIFRVCFIDSFQGKVMANFAKNQLKIESVAILRDVKSDYSVGLSEYFQSTFKKNGGSIVIEQSYSSGDVDFKSQLTAIRGQKPQAIFVPGYYTDVALIARQARELGIQVPLLGGDGWSSPKLIEIAGEAMENSYYSSHFSPDSQDPSVKEFVSLFRKKHGALPNGLSALGFDAGRILIEGLKKAGYQDKEGVRKFLATLKDFQGATGNISIDANRNASKSAVVLKVEHHDLKLVFVSDPVN